MLGTLQVIRDRTRLNDSYKRVFDSPDGRIVLAHLCKVNHVFTSTFVAGDSHQTALHEGQRRLVLSIMRQLNVDINQLEKIAQEISE